MGFSCDFFQVFSRITFNHDHAWFMHIDWHEHTNIYRLVITTLLLVYQLVSKGTEDKILKYIAENNGLVTKNDVVSQIKHELSKPTTFEFLKKLEREEKINGPKGKRKGQAHYLSINDKNKSNQIKEQLSTIEKLIKDKNQYLSRRFEEIYQQIEETKHNEDTNAQTRLDHQQDLVNDLEYYYKNTVTRILEDLYHIITSSRNLSNEDSERFLIEIIELKSQLQYHEWSKDIEKTRYGMDVRNINNLIRRFEKDGLDDYIRGKLIKNRFAEPLIQRINDFKDQFLS